MKESVQVVPRGMAAGEEHVGTVQAPIAGEEDQLLVAGDALGKEDGDGVVDGDDDGMWKPRRDELRGVMVDVRRDAGDISAEFGALLQPGSHAPVGILPLHRKQPISCGQAFG